MELVSVSEHSIGSHELRIEIYMHSSGEFSYRSIIKRNQEVVVKIDSNRMTNLFAFFDSFETRIKDFYSAYGDADENRK